MLFQVKLLDDSRLERQMICIVRHMIYAYPNWYRGIKWPVGKFNGKGCFVYIVKPVYPKSYKNRKPVYPESCRNRKLSLYHTCS